MCKFFYAVTSKNLLLTSLLFLFINTSSEAEYYYAVILAIRSEENSFAFYLKSVTDSYYFSLAIWNSITKEYPNNYASARPPGCPRKIFKGKRGPQSKKLGTAEVEYECKTKSCYR